MKYLYVVMVGNPVDGISLFGAFDDVEAANQWAEDTIKNETWWVVRINAPEEF